MLVLLLAMDAHLAMASAAMHDCHSGARSTREPAHKFDGTRRPAACMLLCIVCIGSFLCSKDSNVKPGFRCQHAVKEAINKESE